MNNHSKLTLCMSSPTYCLARTACWPPKLDLGEYWLVWGACGCESLEWTLWLPLWVTLCTPFPWELMSREAPTINITKIIALTESTIGIISLFDEAYLFSFTLTLQGNIINNIDAPIDVLLLWQKALENEFFIILIQPMKIFCFDLFLS